MASGPQPVEIHGLTFASTSDGHLLESEVRGHLDAIMDRVAGLERENRELLGRLDHLDSLQRLAQETVIKADELAADIQAQARQQADEMLLSCETEIVERKRAFEAELAAEQAAAQARVAQLQTALEGSVQTLARALQAAGAPALEMPPASAPSWSPPPRSASPAAVETSAANGQMPSVAPAEPTDAQDAVAPAWPEAPPGQVDGGFTRFDMAAIDAAQAVPVDAIPSAPGAPDRSDELLSEAPYTDSPSAVGQPPTDVAGLAEEADSEAAPAKAEPEAAGSTPAVEAAPSEPAEAAAPDAAAEAAPVQPAMLDRADEAPLQVPVHSGPITSSGLSRQGPATIEIDMRPVKSFADLARVTKLLGRIAPGAQPVDLNLPQHRALFSVRGKDVQALAAQLQEALPEAKVVARDEGLDVLLEDGE